MSRKLVIEYHKPDWVEIERETADRTGAHFWGCQNEADLVSAIKAWFAEMQRKERA